MKTLVKIFVIASIAITMSTLTSCSTQKVLSRAIENGEYELTKGDNVALRLIEEREAGHYHVLLEDVKATSIEAKKGDREIFGYTFLKMKFQDPKSGKIYDTYSYYPYLGFPPDVEKAKKGQKITVVLDKDSKGRDIALRAEVKIEISTRANSYTY